MERNSETYEGRDGMTHSYTKVDLDIRTKIGTGKLSENELIILKEEIKLEKMRKILAILALPASSVSGKNDEMFDKYLVRDILRKRILWRNAMIQDACLVDDILTHNIFMCAWKNTIAESDWNVDMSYEDIINDKWKELHLKY